MDVFEQLRWLMKGAAEREIMVGILKATEKLHQDFMKSIDVSAVLIERLKRELMRLAGEHGGEAKALQLKQMMEDAMGL